MLSLLALVGLSACSDMSEQPDCPVPVEPGAETKAPWLSIRLSYDRAARQGRANPSGGEDGDGRIDGTSYENRISGVTAFFFDADVDINGTTATTAPVRYIHYFNTSQLATTNDGDMQTEPIQIPELTNGSCNVIIAVNHDYSVAEFSNVRHLAGYVDNLTGLWTSEGEYSTNFLMSSVDVKRLTAVDGSTYENPAIVEVDVQRLAARIDYSTLTDDGHYEVLKESRKVADAQILGASVVNRYKDASYLFKQVADQLEGVDYTSCGKENINASGQPTNWVIDPGTQSGIKAFDNPFLSLMTIPNWQNDAFTVGHPVSDGTTTWHCVGYARENINEINSVADLRKRATGLVFKARYTPVGFVEGETFYVYKNLYYSSLTDIRPLLEIPSSATLTDENCASYGITRYADGICYYTWWIRHANDGNDATYGPMEYAIVRNNLYQVRVTSVLDIGDAEPGDSQLQLEVNVQDWSILPSEDVDLN